MTTDKDIADDFEKWRAYYEKEGYEVTETIWEYEGRNVPMQVIWPAEGTVEHTRMIDAIAKFVWENKDSLSPETSAQNNSTDNAKSPRNRPRSSKKKSDRSS